jgi:hypothetical protein
MIITVSGNLIAEGNIHTLKGYVHVALQRQRNW